MRDSSTFASTLGVETDGRDTPAAGRSEFSGTSKGDQKIARSTTGYFLGIDGGGSKTQAVITNGGCEAIGEGLSGGSNPLRVGLDEAVSHITTAIADACAQAGIGVGDIEAACVALAGINHPTHFQAMKDALDRALGIENLQLVTDAHAALVGALDWHPGVVIIAGTGSIAIGVNEAGDEARSGGWGPTLADEGSGYDIARRALRAIAAAFDGRFPATMLTERVCQRLGISTAADLPGVIYHDNTGSEPVEIASLAELVAETARDGDGVARSILAAAGRELGQLCVSVIERLGMKASTFRVACVGSVFNAGEYVVGPLRDAILQVAPGAQIGPPLFPPTIGAAKLAQASRAAGDCREAPGVCQSGH